ncbi:hypothetical protein [Thermonema rossianum]|uniref:hypothetical protein n=1 Tax=Thermonema rossianum TaxID=55505 RepID=UPI00056E834E|nr:hypothetical protein [Thermonema rossianum]
MSKTTIWILTSVLFVAAFFIAFQIYDTVRKPIEKKRNIELTEQAIIQRLEIIRKLEQAYYAKYGCYADSWEKLLKFALEDSLYNISKHEEDLGNDSVIVTYDTLSVVAVHDSLLKGMSTEEIAQLPLRPSIKDVTGYTLEEETETEQAAKPDTFFLYVGQTENFGNTICLIYVADPNPENPDRKAGKKPVLAFGSQTELTTKGTWEF